MSKVFWWMALKCAWLSVLGMPETNAATALVSAPEQPLVSVSAAGPSMVSGISATGRFVLFVSSAADLVTNGLNESPQLFLRDRALGVTLLVSSTPEHAGANRTSFGYFVDEAGQKVVFQSGASDLTDKDENDASDVFMRDMVTGTTTLLSASTNGAAGNGDSRYPITTPDGLFVAFESTASDLVENDTNRVVDVFLRDITTGLVTCASQIPKGFSATSPTENQLDGLSANGQYVLFSSSWVETSVGGETARHGFLRDTLAQTTLWISSNVPTVTGGVYRTADCSKPVMTPDAKYFLFVAQRPATASALPLEAVTCRYELSTGATTVIATNPVAVAQDNTGALDPVITDDGRFAAYTIRSASSPIVDQVYRWDFLTGSNVLVSVNTNGVTPGNGFSDSPQISPDGRMVLFQTAATDIVPQGVSGGWTLILRDMDTGTSRLVRIKADGTSVSDEALGGACATPDFKTIAFDSGSSMIVPGDANGESDVFVRTIEPGGIELASVSDPRAASVTVAGLHSSFVPGMSSDGRFIGFVSFSGALSVRDTNQSYDVFLRDTVGGTTRLVTLNRTGAGSAVGGVNAPAGVSDDGRFVAFSSIADDLNDLDTNRFSDVYVRDVVSGTNILVSKNVFGVSGGSPGSSDPIVAPGGEFVLYASRAPSMVPGLSSGGRQWIYKYDMQAGTNMNIPYPREVLSTYQSSILSTSDDRRTVVVGFGGGTRADVKWFEVFDLGGGRQMFCTNNVYQYASISGDGQRLAYARKRLVAPLFELVYVDLTNRLELAVIALDATAFNNVYLNRDGSKVAYEIVPRLSAGASSAQVYLWDTGTGSNTLASATTNGQPAQGKSTLVGISPDGGRVVFNSRAADLVADDGNGFTDAFVRDFAQNQTYLLSKSLTKAGSGNSLSVAMALSGDGSSVVFNSAASDLIENDHNGASDLFVVRVPDAGSDSDADGLPDDWERLYFADLSHSASEDADQDGLSNLAEFEAGTSPTDHGSVLRISGLAPQLGGGLRLTWTAVSGKTYRVQYADDLGDPTWQNLPGDITPAGLAGERDLDGAKESRFYRVILAR